MPVLLSILLPTHRSDLRALSRIAQACSWADPSVEVIVRDNSGDPRKRAQIADFARDHCTIISVEPCGPRENYSELLRVARGEFVFCLGDDDLLFDRVIAALPGRLEQLVHAHDVVGVTGTYLLESSQGSALAGYRNIDSDDVAARVAGYLDHGGANVLMYAPQRRAVVERIFRFIAKMPFSLSYHDQITCLLYLLTGKFVGLPNVIYGYDVGPWEHLQSAQDQDVGYSRAAGLDPAINKLHWFMCGFEGAVLIRNSDIFPDYSMAQRQKMADQWFSTMFMRFLNNPRLTFESGFAVQADAVCEKLRASQGRLSFVDMLIDICQLIALSSDVKAQAYLSFWGEALKSRKSAPVSA
jgi:hypothetical protein